MAEAAAARGTTSRVFDPAQAPEFRSLYGQRAFAVNHNLKDHPLFQLPRLVEASRRLPPQDIFFRSGEVNFGTSFDAMPAKPFTVQEAIERIYDVGCWVVLKRVETDPDFRDLLDTCMGEIRDLTGEPLDRELVSRECFVFLTSPGNVTPYHIDPESNFLLQIAGSKTIGTLSPKDRSALPFEELERFYVGDPKGVVYSDEKVKSAQYWHVTPGVGIHVPLNAPHWVKNDDAVSITFSVSFEVRAFKRWARVNKTNFYLRRAGITPRPVGESPLIDGAKAAVGQFVSQAADLTRKLRKGNEKGKGTGY